VFEPFFTTKMDVGTGLGLFTVHGTVRRWNGKILVDSTPGEGTCFEIEIPKWRAEEADPPETGSDAVTPARRCSILVVDDEPVVRDALYGTLSRNHQVTTAEDGTHAIKQFVGGNYDVVFLDLGMPGLPGDAISREFRRADPLISTVLITGWDLDEDDERLGSFDFQLQKPIAAADLENVLSRAIDLRDRRARGGEAQRA